MGNQAKMKNKDFVQKTVVFNTEAQKMPPAKVVRHPISRNFKCMSAVVMPCQCIIQPTYNSTRTILNSIESLKDKKFDSHKLLQDKVIKNDILIKSVNQKAALKVTIPFCKRQYQDLIGIYLTYSTSDSE